MREGHKEKRLVGSPVETFVHMLKNNERRNNPELPFQGAAIGYFAYEVGNWFEKLPKPKSDDLDVADAWWGWYDTAVLLEEETQLSWAVGTREKIDQWKKIGEGVRLTEIRPPKLGPLTARMDPQAHRHAVERIHREIVGGHVYQVNLTYRCDAPFDGDPLEVMKKALEIDAPPYAAYLDCGDYQIVSLSPELFLRKSGTSVETHPMKGTRPRGEDADQDVVLEQELLGNEKERAEHVMIVDLERNDFGKLAVPGTVKVDSLFGVRGYPTVWQMVSTVKAEIPESVGVAEIMRAIFPGGSITGAPKLSAMKLIHELEPVPRRVYTGALGYVGWEGSIMWNMPIRTMVFKDEQVHFHVGGGITIDSDPDREFEETVVKSRAMLSALGAQ